MNASKACDVVISTLKESCLNFFLQESPFGITINVRKSFIKNQAGKEFHPQQERFWGMKDNADDENKIIPDSTEEKDEKYSDTRISGPYGPVKF